MSKKVFVTRKIPDVGVSILQDGGYEVRVNLKDRPLSKKELIKKLKNNAYDAVLCLLTDKIDAEIFDASPNTKIFANYAVGYDNIDITEAKKRGIAITNTPSVLTESVAEHAFALIFAVARRIVESDSYLRRGKYKGWAPELLLGTELRGKTLGILGAGRIGSRVGVIGSAFGMKIIYYDVKRSEEMEKENGALFKSDISDVLSEADVVSVHVPLIPETRHLINAERLAKMKPSAYLVNTSRGAVIDETALVEALKRGVIKGAGLDVFEHEPKLAKGLSKLSNAVLTPHTASATYEARDAMSRLSAESIVDFFQGRALKNRVV